MSAERKSPSWWQTVPGMLTAIAGIITAVTGLIVALHQIGLFSGQNDAPREMTTKANPEPGPSSKTAPWVTQQVATALFFDDFSNARRDPRWKILNHDPGKTTVQPAKGTLLIVSQKGSISGAAANLRNQYVLDIDLPRGNFEVITKLALQLHSSHHSISVGLFKDDDNFLELIYWGKPHVVYGVGREVDNNFDRVFSFVKEEGGRQSVSSTKNNAMGPSQEPMHFMFKIDRNGNEYRGYIASVSNTRPPSNLDQIQWRKIGTHAWINFDGKVALWASNGNATIFRQGMPPEVAAEFDFVLIREK